MTHHWFIEHSVALGNLTKEQLKLIGDADERLIGYLTYQDSEAEAESRSERDVKLGIRRPAWFNPVGPTVSDVGRIGLQMRGKA